MGPVASHEGTRRTPGPDDFSDVSNHVERARVGDTLVTAAGVGALVEPMELGGIAGRDERPVVAAGRETILAGAVAQLNASADASKLPLAERAEPLADRRAERRPVPDLEAVSRSLLRAEREAREPGELVRPFIDVDAGSGLRDRDHVVRAVVLRGCDRYSGGWRRPSPFGRLSTTARAAARDK